MTIILQIFVYSALIFAVKIILTHKPTSYEVYYLTNGEIQKKVKNY